VAGNVIAALEARHTVVNRFFVPTSKSFAQILEWGGQING